MQHTPGFGLLLGRGRASFEGAISCIGSSYRFPPMPVVKTQEFVVSGAGVPGHPLLLNHFKFTVLEIFTKLNSLLI